MKGDLVAKKFSAFLSPDRVAAASAKLDQDEAWVESWIRDDPATVSVVMAMLKNKPADVVESLREGPEDLTQLVCLLARMTIIRTLVA